MTGLIIKFDKARARIATSVMADKDSSFAVGESLARNLMADDLKGVLVLADGIEINGDLLSSGCPRSSRLMSLLEAAWRLMMTGFRKHWLRAIAGPSPGLAVAVGFYGESLQVGTGIGSGWQASGKEFMITASRLNKLYDMDDHAALDIYEQHLGAECEQLPMSGLRFPLRIKDPANPNNRLVRTILGIDRDVGMMTFAGNMPEGWSAELMHATKETLAEAAGDAVLPGQTAPQVCILVSCIGRKLVMGKDCGEELKTFLRKLGTKPALSGFYSYGEFSTASADAGCQLFNQTLTAFSLCEERAPAQAA